MSEPVTLEDVRARLERLIEALDESFLERQEHIRLALLALLAGHHVLLVGPPGTAKSLLARALTRCVRDTRYFEYLLSRFTHPDELFGPVSIPGLKEEDYRRMTKGYLPSAHVAFLDEIFKANSAILNSLLTLINERVYHHGMHRDVVPLLGLVGASNELPEADGPLAALFDRFLVRMVVPPLADEVNFLRVGLGDVAPFEPGEDDVLSVEMIALLGQGAAHIEADSTIRDALVRIRRGFEEEGIGASDRRWRWAIDMLKIAAVACGRSRLSFADVLLLEHCFGSPTTDAAAVRRIVRAAVRLDQQIDLDWTTLMAHWETLRAQLQPTEGNLAEAVEVRRAGLDAAREALAVMREELNVTRASLLDDITASIWVLDPPPETISGIIALRRRLQTCLERLDAYEASLGEIDLIDHMVEQQRGQGAARARGRKFNFFYDDDETAGFFIASPGAPPESWVAVEEGAVVLDARRLDQLRSQPIGSPPWHEVVLCLRLDEGQVLALLRDDGWREALDALLAEAELGARGEDVASQLSTLIEAWRALGCAPLPVLGAIP